MDPRTKLLLLLAANATASGTNERTAEISALAHQVGVEEGDIVEPPADAAPVALTGAAALGAVGTGSEPAGTGA
jgi:hypothetical protein